MATEEERDAIEREWLRANAATLRALKRQAIASFAWADTAETDGWCDRRIAEYRQASELQDDVISTQRTAFHAMLTGAFERSADAAEIQFSKQVA